MVQLQSSFAHREINFFMLVFRNTFLSEVKYHFFVEYKIFTDNRGKQASLLLGYSNHVHNICFISKLIRAKPFYT